MRSADSVPAEAIILAGGLGTRLRSVVSDLPKPLAPVAGRPFLAYLLDCLVAQGVRRAVLSVGYRREAIVAAFGDRHGPLRLDYAVEEEPLGTGGGLALALDRLEGPAAVALNGDTFLRLAYSDLARAQAATGAPFALALRPVQNAARFGAAVLKGGRLAGFQAAGGSGPGLINGGVYLLSKDLFASRRLPRAFSFERDFLEPLAPSLRPAAVVAEGDFIDIGVPDSYAEAQRVLPGWIEAAVAAAETRA